jgi:hypothetical protein
MDILALLVLARWLVPLVLSSFVRSTKAADFYHQTSSDFNDEPQKISFEPGFWRPRWIMDREFFGHSGEKTKKDRLYFKMCSDRTIRIFNPSSKKISDLWFKRRQDSKLVADLGLNNSKEWAAAREQQLKSLFGADGSWSWSSEEISGIAEVRIETKEGPHRRPIVHGYLYYAIIFYDVIKTVCLKDSLNCFLSQIYGPNGVRWMDLPACFVKDRYSRLKVRFGKVMCPLGSKR